MVTRLRASRSTLSAAVLLAVALALASPAAPQQVKGPTTCFKCHKLAKQVWETKAPFHKTSTQQLTAANAAKYAAAIGLATPTTVKGKGDCVSCHATLVGGAPSVGTSCESCHGAASGYYVPHQEPAFYAQPEAQWQGLRNLSDKPGAIAQMCVDCHVTPEPRLRAAGHPDGSKFDAGAGMARMEHWPSGDTTVRLREAYGPALYAKVTAEGRARSAKRLASSGPAAAKPATDSTPAISPGTGPPVSQRPPLPTPPLRRGEGSSNDRTPSAGAPARPSPPRAASANTFDWDEPVAELPADYPSDTAVATSPDVARPATGPAPAASPPAPTVAAPRAASRSAAAKVPSTAPEEPALPVEAVVAPPPARLASAPPTDAPAAPEQPLAELAALRGRGALLLAELLKGRKGALELPAPSAPVEFAGPDGELLRVQDEILYLVLEALRKEEP